MGIPVISIPCPNLCEESWYSDRLFLSLYGPLKTYYDQEATKWLKCHPGRAIMHYKVAVLFAKACGKAAINHNSLSGFAKTGIWPCNPVIISDYLFRDNKQANKF
jgi:hypothetical protein